MLKQEPVNQCPVCGWKYPWQIRRLSCKMCHSPMKNTRCYRCGTYVPLDERPSADHTYCAACTKELHDKRQKDLTQRLEDAYEDWLQRIERIPKPYKSLTNQQWVDACVFFGGCALCGADEISARGFLIPFKQGGRYCDWNVIPLCEKCAASTKTQPNVWKRMGYRNTPTLRRIVDYLEPILEEKLNEAR